MGCSLVEEEAETLGLAVLVPNCKHFHTFNGGFKYKVGTTFFPTKNSISQSKYKIKVSEVIQWFSENNTNALSYFFHWFINLAPKTPLKIIMGGNNELDVMSIVGRTVHPALPSISELDPILFSPFGARTVDLDL